MKKILLRITAIILIQAFMPNCAWAQEVVFSQALPCSGKSTLAPAIQIDLPGLRDRFLTKVIISALEENGGYVPRTAKATGISPRTIYRLIPREKISVISKQAEERKREIILRQLELNQGNVSETARDLKMHRTTVQKFSSTPWREAIRKNKRQSEKDELSLKLKKHCLSRGWLKDTARELGIPKGTLRDKIRRLGIVIADIKKEVELEALRQEKGNVLKAARRLGVTRARLSKHREEIKALRRPTEIAEINKRIAETELFLAGIKVSGLKAKEERNINLLREFLSDSYERVKEHKEKEDYLDWLGAEDKLQRKLLPLELLERIGRHKEIVKRLEKNIGDIERSRRRDMNEGIDKIVKVIDTFFKQERIVEFKPIARRQVLVEQAI
ncbi:MAG: hypothetical protein KKF93_03930 [Candidatus Omnitrophica bacterium]|nr:hypothetical protein [Candidatus Omnitrophota bacterium]